LSGLLRFRLNHFFLLDLSLPSMLPFSGLSVLLCSAGYLLLLLEGPTELTIVRSVVNAEWMSSLSLNISSTCRDWEPLATYSSNVCTECHNILSSIIKINIQIVKEHICGCTGRWITISDNHVRGSC
jgi:hypothetical protein